MIHTASRAKPFNTHASRILWRLNVRRSGSANVCVLPALLAGRTNMHIDKVSLQKEQSFYLLKLHEQMAAEDLVAKEDKQENAETKVPTGREEFVVRLIAALHAVGCEPNATKLVRAFNLRYPDESVTIQAARKWLLGEAFPSEPKLLALAHWLDVDPAWLRFGETEWRPNPDLSATYVDGLERDLALLTTVERGLMRQMLDLILAGRTSHKR